MYGDIFKENRDILENRLCKDDLFLCINDFLFILKFNQKEI